VAELKENKDCTNLLGIFLEEILYCMERVNLEVSGLELYTIKSPEQIQKMIPVLLKFPMMSFLELHYRRSGVKEQPGIRFLWEKTESGRQVRSVLFRDTLFWNVDHNLAKIEEELAIFRLEAEEIQAQPSQLLVRRFDAAEDWRAWLHHTIVFPIPSGTDSSL